MKRGLQDFVFVSESKEPVMSLKGDVCVVTGACGFLGKRLVRLLLAEEKLAEIRLTDRQVRPDHLQTLEGKIYTYKLLFI